MFDKKRVAAIVAFSLTVPAANWMIGNIGTTCIPDGPCLIPVGFNLYAPSGVLMIGLALVLRDLVHEKSGRLVAFCAVLFGAALSFAVSAPAIAVASAVAFLISETADLVVYDRLRKTSTAAAVLASQIVGAAIDSAIFVYIAFGSMEFSAGNTLAKIYAGVAVAAIIFAMDWRRNSLSRCDK